MTGIDGFDRTPRVEGVHLHVFQGGFFDAQAIGKRVGSHGSGMCMTHDVFDVPVSALKEPVKRSIPDSIASNEQGTILRLYVPKKDNGRVGEIGLMNGVYRSPSNYPLARTNGAPIYTAPTDRADIRAQYPTRPKGGLQRPWSDGDTWQPGPGDRFRVTEYP